MPQASVKRLIEVEKQLQAIAEQISKYEGERTDLEKEIIANDRDLAQVNSELAEVQSRLALVERDLDRALENYDFSLNDLVAVQENIIQEQIKLGKIKSEISDMILSAFPDATLELKDTMGDNNHFEAKIISKNFVGKSKIEQHKMVYKALKGKMGNELHALALTTEEKNG